MANTNHIKIEFGQVAQVIPKEFPQSTQGISKERIEMMKIIQKETDGNVICSYKKVNYADQKVKEAYRKINKMLGGN